MITGDSGTGKSYMAQLLHEYAIAQQVIAPDAPFINFNCAQYASNPELLAANLFGYVKGAFTGAVSDRAGAFEAAQGGILFLDEVHRLNAEGQEKLFTARPQGDLPGGRNGAGAAGAGTADFRHYRGGAQHLSYYLYPSYSHSGDAARFGKPQPTGEAGADAAVFLARGAAGGRQPAAQPAADGGAGKSYLARQRRRDEERGEIQRRLRTARQRGQTTIEVTLHDLPETVMAQLPALGDPQVPDEPLLIDRAASPDWLLRQQNGARLLIQETQLSVLALFARWRGGLMAWEEMEKRMGGEIEMLFDRLIFDNRDREASSMLLLTSSRARGILPAGEALRSAI